ncbi:MAG: UDP-N-acetylmuramoyl-L-alanyl-D-glutamate--2,6-diaminopimelate ligase [Candidatus Omnitrophota bacterium]|nr:UDP-N-acetylmuramoyl-L-alanyl-D-glutamate--2,6-diaminopimelate ligase [Candidatus Omnitrophota bacterium]
MTETDKIIKKMNDAAGEIRTDSRLVSPGDVFVAIKGCHLDGNRFISEALDRGAACVVCERSRAAIYDGQDERIEVVRDSRETLGELARIAFRDPSKDLVTYGITGTNGKTTTVYLIDSILNMTGRASGFMSTVAVKSRGNSLKPSEMTTPDVISVNRELEAMLRSGKTHAVIEISSHALSQKRTAEIKLDIAVFTNITPEHLDYHGSMGPYLEEKAKIFDHLKIGGLGVINADDVAVKKAARCRDLFRCITFGIGEDAEIRAEAIEYSETGTRFILNAGKHGSVPMKISMLGAHNVYNVMGAAACLVESGISLDEFKKGAESFKGVPGRLQEISSDAPFRVFVDYAHTPVALEQVLGALRNIVTGKLICMFGCGGDRDKQKRPLMGKVVSSMADEAVVTSDNSRTEKTSDIIGQITDGMSDGCVYTVEEDRGNAVKKVLEKAGRGDIVIVAGKGHENYQIIGNRRFPFDDAEIVKGILKNMGFAVKV